MLSKWQHSIYLLLKLELIVEKRSDKPEYTEDDDSVTYYLAVTNNGQGNAANVRLTDEISELQNSAGNKVFTDWTIEGGS